MQLVQLAELVMRVESAAGIYFGHACDARVLLTALFALEVDFRAGEPGGNRRYGFAALAAVYFSKGKIGQGHQVVLRASSPASLPGASVSDFCSFLRRAASSAWRWRYR